MRVYDLRHTFASLLDLGGAGSSPVGRVPAGEIEGASIGQLRAVFRQSEIVASM